MVTCVYYISRDLWTKLSRDTVFYNPVTGAVGQFQWTRSETNKSYLNALGVTFSSEEVFIYLYILGIKEKEIKKKI